MQKSESSVAEREEKIVALYEELERQRISMQNNQIKRSQSVRKITASIKKWMNSVFQCKNLNQAVAEREEKIVALYEELERQRISMQNNLDQAIAEREEKITVLYQEMMNSVFQQKFNQQSQNEKKNCSSLRRTGATKNLMQNNLDQAIAEREKITAFPRRNG